MTGGEALAARHPGDELIARNTMTDINEETLPEPVLNLFTAAFANDNLAEDTGMTPEAYRTRLAELLPGVIRSQQTAFAQARDLFLRNDPTHTSARVLARVDAQVAQPSGFADDELCSDDEFEVLLDLAADQDDAEQYESAAAMYGLLQVVRPDQIQPFINSNIIVWRLVGVEAAAQAYAITVPVLQHPVYSYHAADCLIAAGQSEAAAAAIEYAREQSEEPEWQGVLDRESLETIAEIARQLAPEIAALDGAGEADPASGIPV